VKGARWIQGEALYGISVAFDYLFLIKTELDTRNPRCLHQLGNPALLSEADNNNGAKHLTDDKFRGVKSALHLDEGTQVMLKQNISAPLSLVNGTTGVVNDFVCAESVEAPSLLEYVWVDCGDQYKGTTFFVSNP
jgi:hypothetical protein